MCGVERKNKNMFNVRGNVTDTTNVKALQIYMMQGTESAFMHDNQDEKGRFILLRCVSSRRLALATLRTLLLLFAKSFAPGTSGSLQGPSAASESPRQAVPRMFSPSSSNVRSPDRGRPARTSRAVPTDDIAASYTQPPPILPTSPIGSLMDFLLPTHRFFKALTSSR